MNEFDKYHVEDESESPIGRLRLALKKHYEYEGIEDIADAITIYIFEDKLKVTER